MSNTHKINRSYATGAGNVANIIATYTGDVEKNLDTNVPASTTAEPVNIQWVVAKVQSMMLWASGACTVLTNSATTPTDTVTLAANQLLSWGTSDPGTPPISHDVTAGLFVTNPSSTAAVSLKIRVLLSV